MVAKVVVLVLLLATCSLVYGQGTCNVTKCAGNNDCRGNIQCLRCNNNTNVCVTGEPCGGKCVVDSDCNVLVGCSLCTNGMCQNNPNGCGAKCQNDNGCSDPWCTACIGGFCTTGYGCNHPCNSSNDCSATGNCTQCVQSQCVAPCLGWCSKTSDCEPGCANCLEGVCSTNPTTTTGMMHSITSIHSDVYVAARPADESPRSNGDDESQPGKMTVV